MRLRLECGTSDLHLNVLTAGVKRGGGWMSSPEISSDHCLSVGVHQAEVSRSLRRVPVPCSTILRVPFLPSLGSSTSPTSLDSFTYPLQQCLDDQLDRQAIPPFGSSSLNQLRGEGCPMSEGKAVGSTSTLQPKDALFSTPSLSQRVVRFDFPFHLLLLCP